MILWKHFEEDHLRQDRVEWRSLCKQIKQNNNKKQVNNSMEGSTGKKTQKSERKKTISNDCLLQLNPPLVRFEEEFGSENKRGMEVRREGVTKDRY